jgi:hypothetical protein
MTAPLSEGMLSLIQSLAGGDLHQKRPELIPVLKLRKLAV